MIEYRFYAARHRKARSRQSRRLAKAIGEDYATGAVGNDLSIQALGAESCRGLCLPSYDGNILRNFACPTAK